VVESDCDALSSIGRAWRAEVLSETGLGDLGLYS
jgi:pantoate kinase